MGELAPPALKMFAEEGDAAAFDRQSQGHNGIFDAFTAAPLARGMGQASSKIFVDGLHSKVHGLEQISNRIDRHLDDCGTSVNNLKA